MIMKRYFIFIVVILTLFSCTSPKFMAGKRPGRNTFYFPPDTEKHDTLYPYGREDKLDTFTNQWYSKHLYTLKEPVLYNAGKDLEIYRFTYLPTSGQPLTFRIEKLDTIITITRSQTSGLGGYRAGHLKNTETRKLTPKEFSAIAKNFTASGFWSMPTHTERGLDGEEWILEGFVNGKYHVVTRWSPEYDLQSNQTFITLCLTFSGLYKSKQL